MFGMARSGHLAWLGMVWYAVYGIELLCIA